MRLLVVEDDRTISDPLCRGLEREGFDVSLAETGESALEQDPGDLVLLDLGLPDLDGQTVARRLRERSDVPIIVVTARGDEIDRVTLLEIGADDYVVKPFGYRELVARIRAVLRRASAAPITTTTQQLGPVTIDRRTRAVTFNGESISLTPKEYDLLVFLASDPGAVFSRERILESVWDEHWWGSTKTLDVHVASLRRKLGADLIETIRGVGFRVSAEPAAP